MVSRSINNKFKLGKIRDRMKYKIQKVMDSLTDVCKRKRKKGKGKENG